MVASLGAQLGPQQLLSPGISGGKFGLLTPTRLFAEGDAVVLIRLILRAQAAAAELHATAAQARKRGAEEIAHLAAEAAALEGRLAEQAAKLAQNFGKVGEKSG